MKRNCVRFVIFFLLAWAVSAGKAEPPKDPVPTITIEGKTFLAYPKGYQELEAQIEEKENQLQLLLEETHNLQYELRDLKDRQRVKEDVFIAILLNKIISKHPNYNTLNAEFPLDDLTPALSDLYNQIKRYYFKGYENEESFKELAKQIWASRPCALNSEPAQVALKFWTAFMRGDYNEAEKYASGELKDLIKEVKLNPQTNRAMNPVDPDYVGFIAFSEFNSNVEYVEYIEDAHYALQNEELAFYILPGKIANSDFETRILKAAQIANQDLDLKEMAVIITAKDKDGHWKAMVQK